MERTLEKNDQGYKNLKAVAAMLGAFSKHGAAYEVRDVYLDMGQDWMWTTICRKGYMDCQVLCPRDWRAIVLANTVEDLAEVVNVIRNGDYFHD